MGTERATALGRTFRVSASGISTPGSKEYDESLPNREEIEIVKKWVIENGAWSHVIPSNTPTSYGWKHIIERRVGRFISNGALIQAVDELRLPLRTVAGSLNCYVGLKIPNGPPDLVEYFRQYMRGDLAQCFQQSPMVLRGQGDLLITDAVNSVLGHLAEDTAVQFDLGEIWEEIKRKKKSIRSLVPAIRRAIEIESGGTICH